MKTFDMINNLNIQGEVLADVPMKSMTTMRVGGRADCVVHAACEEDVQSVVCFCRTHDVPLTVVGRGSNLIVRDGGLRGVVLHLGKTFAQIRADGCVLTAQAGASMGALARTAQEYGLTGLEFAEGIPGSVGGGVYMNAGAYGGEMSQTLQSVRVLTQAGEIAVLDAAALEMRYRHTTLMETGGIVLEAVFALQQDDPSAIAARMADYAQRRREKQPLQYPSAGSFFKRPEGYFAGKLIQDAGLKGASVGGAQISELHAGFMINRGDATALDILNLMQKVQREVQQQFGVKLEAEVRIIGEDASEADAGSVGEE